MRKCKVIGVGERRPPASRQNLCSGIKTALNHPLSTFCSQLSCREEEDRLSAKRSFLLAWPRNCGAHLIIHFGISFLGLLLRLISHCIDNFDKRPMLVKCDVKIKPNLFILKMYFFSKPWNYIIRIRPNLASNCGMFSNQFDSICMIWKWHCIAAELISNPLNLTLNGFMPWEMAVSIQRM